MRGPGFPNGLDHLLAGQAGPEASVTITLNVPVKGVYDVTVSTKKHVNRGIVQLSVNGSNVGAPMDQYSENDALQEFDLGNDHADSRQPTL